MTENHAVTIRQPSTANLMLDSADRNTAIFANANSFQISKNQSLFNGFFTRIGTTELVLEWFTPNISPAFNNNRIVIELSGGVGVTGPQYSSGIINLNGFYTQADLVDLIKEYLDIGGGLQTPAVSFNIQTIDGVTSIVPDNNVFIRVSNTLAGVLNLPVGWNPYSTLIGLPLPPVDLRAIRYLDFLSQQLTYNQDLKDASTAPVIRDVLARWYMAWDSPPALDAYGYPILMGYQPFVCRRTFSPPKQIKWDSIQPLGNLAFEVYAALNQNNQYNSVLAPFSTNTNWLMTLQVSEN